MLMAFIVLFVLGTLVIFLSKKNSHLKFLYPGLVTFFVFMILPILFTVYISFTNIKTGHFLTKKEALTVLLEEKMIGKNSETYHFKLKKLSDGEYFITVKSEVLDNNGENTFYSFFSLEDKKIKILLPESKRLNEVEYKNFLTPYEILSLRDKLNSLTFQLESKDSKLKVHRTDLLLNLKPRYEKSETPEGQVQLKDMADNTIYIANDSNGYFESGDKRLIPGFYVNIGLGNFLSLAKDKSIASSFLRVMGWTLTWSFVSVFLTFVFGMFLAIFLNEKGFKLKKVYRIFFIVPYAIPAFISILVFKGMLNKDFGILNEILGTFGITPLAWLETPLMAKISCLMVNLWLGFPYMFLVTTGILQSIPESIYEAAKIDGASRWITFKKLTLPLLMSGIAPLLIGSFAFNMNNFVGIYLLTGGGPPVPGATTSVGTTDILISYTYRLAFEGAGGQDFGLASSIALVIFVIITLLTVLNFRLSRSTMNNS